MRTDFHDTTLGNPDILYRRFLDNGSTFPNVIKNLSSGSEDNSSNPAIAAAANVIHVVWETHTLMPGGGDLPEVVYRTSSDNGATFPALITNLSTNTGGSTFPAIARS